MLLSIISPWSTHSCNECDNKTKRDVNGGYWVKSWQRHRQNAQVCRIVMTHHCARALRPKVHSQMNRKVEF